MLGARPVASARRGQRNDRQRCSIVLAGGALDLLDHGGERDSGAAATLKALVHATRRDVGLRALQFTAHEIGIPDDQVYR